jgi:hypothetical protein
VCSTICSDHSAKVLFTVSGFISSNSSGAIHRVCAVIFLGVFFAHLIYVLIHIGRNWKTFRWFGPNSLIPLLRFRRLLDRGIGGAAAGADLVGSCTLANFLPGEGTAKGSGIFPIIKAVSTSPFWKFAICREIF